MWRRLHEEGGVIYFLEAVGLGLVKIGCSIDPRTRLQKLDEMMPCDTRVLLVREGGKAHEQELHRRFAAQRVRGEWFRFDLEVRAAVETLRGEGVIEFETKRCVDCRIIKKRARNKRCRKCAGEHRAARVRAGKRPRPTCPCGTAVGRQSKSGLCKPCAMRRAWARDDYRAAIMPSRLARRRHCACGQRLGKQNRSGLCGECWNRGASSA